MGAKWRAAAAVIGFGIAVCAVFGLWKYQKVDKKEERVWHHELAKDADPTLGSETIPADFMVDETFTSHLPLVIIDTGGEEIVNYKYYDFDSQSFRYKEGVDPYIEMQISFVDHENMANRLGDEPTGSSYGKIKVRGNSSSSVLYPKKQYLIKLQTQDGQPDKRTVLGMTASDTWILNGTQLDRSYLRNYISMNTAGEISPYTPDMRFCEMVLKKEDRYEYMGLYGMYEKIEKGEGRVDLEKDGGYLLLRDRIDLEGRFMSVWSTEHQRNSNWLNLEYPSPNRITDEDWNSICNDIKQIEDRLYSDDGKKFAEYRNLLDVDSFVDYFIINEFFANYDAGWNSTFLFKNRGEKLRIGPFWDFDGALDDFTKEMLEIREMALQDAPWFERLVTDEYFLDKVVERYGQLRKSVLDREALYEKIDQAAAFIEKPVKRDVSRWAALYDNPMQLNIEKDTGVEVDRNTLTWEDEVQRMKDIIRQHGNFLDSNITDLYRFVRHGDEETPNTLLGVYFIIAFFVSIILVQRARDGIR